MKINLSRKVGALSLSFIVAASGLGLVPGSYAERVDVVSTATKQVTIDVVSSATKYEEEKKINDLDPNDTFTILIDGEKDFKLEFNNKLNLTGVSSVENNKVDLKTLKGKSLEEVLKAIKNDLLYIRIENSVISSLSKNPVIVGLGHEISSEAQMEKVNSIIADEFKSKAVILMKLEKDQTIKDISNKENYLNQLNRKRLEKALDIETLSNDEYKFLLENDIIMSSLGNFTEEITYKAVDALIFDDRIDSLSDDDDDDDNDDDDDDDDNDDDDDDDDDDEE